MKNYFRLLLIFILAAVLAFTSCNLDGGSEDDGGGSEDDGGAAVVPFDNASTAGEKVTVTADGVSFEMIYVPGGLTCPIGIDDDNTAEVTDAYWIGETEVTYELWQKVYTWATSGSGGATGEGDYNFANAGREGNNGTIEADPTGAKNEPVTTVNWRDSMVWCNALTEWYNVQKGTSDVCVYTYSSSIIRDSRDGNATACDGAVVSASAKGFRLLSSNEYELAARYRGTDTTNVVTGEIGSVDFDVMATKWTTGNSASGDTHAYNATPLTVGDYAVYSVNSGSSTAVVKSKTANALGACDMSGNVWEWCFDFGSGSYRVRWGGGYNFAANLLRVGYWFSSNPSSGSYNIGFRFSRTQ